MISPEYQSYAAWLDRYHKDTAEVKKFQLVYLAAPYSKFEDKEKLMTEIMRISGEYMMKNPGQHVVSPLFNHFSLHLVPGMGGDYEFWKDYSTNLIHRCDKLLVLMMDGWMLSTGVQDEIKMATAMGIPIQYLVINI